MTTKNLKSYQNSIEIEYVLLILVKWFKIYLRIPQTIFLSLPITKIFFLLLKTNQFLLKTDLSQDCYMLKTYMT